METKRSSALLILAAIVMLLVVVLGAYVGGYFLLSTRWSIDKVTYRMFETDVEATMFGPAARLEAIISGKEVSAESRRTIRTVPEFY
jgi:hypothetical protein